MKNQITQFEIGNIYQAQFIGDSDLKPEYICVYRSKQYATFQKFKTTETIRRKINTFRGVERVQLGSYSMAPSIWADRISG